VVAIKHGQPVLIRHIADVALGTAPVRGVGSTRGKPAVVLGVQRQPAANTLELTRRLDATMADIQKSLPAGMKIETRLFRQADFIEVSIANLMAALRDGAILIVAIVFAFLLSVRSTAITLVALPLSLVATVLSLKLLGATINTMTLGGIAIALGALVDDAIIVVENVVRRLRENHLKDAGKRESTMHVVFLATKEIQGSIVFATLIIMLVFVPLFFLSGIEGRLMVPLGLAYVISLFASLLVSITVTPVLASMFLGASKEITAPHEPRFVHWLRAAYRRVLDRTVKRWQAIAAGSAALLVVALAALGMAGQSFPARLQRGHADGRRRDPARHRAGGIGPARAVGRRGLADASRSDRHGAADRTFAARSACARCASVGTRSQPEDGERVARNNSWALCARTLPSCRACKSWSASRFRIASITCCRAAEPISR
jgi:Cu/Ag efflux pump CusA